MGGEPEGSSATFARLLREARLRADLTQAMLAEKAGMSIRSVQHLEAARGWPYADTALRLAEALELSGEARQAFEASARRRPKPRTRRAVRRSAEPGAGNLPKSLTSFIGRDEAMAELRRHLRSASLLTLTGAGGAGKTRLAIEVAQTTQNQYQDGIVFVDLAPLTDPALVPRVVATALEVAEVPGRPIAETLIDVLRDRSLLLVLDNCEHVLSASSVLVQALSGACPSLRILATSRSPLGLSEELVWRVPPLSLPAAGGIQDLEASESGRLFIDRATSTAPGFVVTPRNAEAIAQVCLRLEGIPLALELAASRLRGLGVAELADRLDASFALLGGGGSQRPRRQQTLRATVDWSYALLSDNEKQVFARLSVFHGGCQLEAIEAVCSDLSERGSSVIDLLAELVDKSLVGAQPRPDGSMRYHVLEPLRQYGAERLGESASAELAQQQHARYYVTALARRWGPVWWGPDLAERLAFVEQELDNIRTALSWVSSNGCRETALGVAYALGPFWLLSARVGEGRTRLAELVEYLPAAADATPTRAGALVWLGGLATQDGDYEVGEQALQRGLDLARACADDLAETYALMWLAITAGLQQDPLAACGYAGQGLTVSRAGGYRALEAMCLRVLAFAAFEGGKLAEAQRLCEEGLAAGRAAQHPPSVAWALETLGFIRFAQGSYAAARTLFEESLAQGRGMLAAAIRQNTIVCLALVAVEQGDLAEAFRRASEAMDMLRTLPGGRISLALPLEAMAQIAAAADRPVVALRLAGAAAAWRSRNGAPLTPSQRTQLERWLDRARQALDPAEADAAWLTGQSLDSQQALTEARALHEVAEGTT